LALPHLFVILFFRDIYKFTPVFNTAERGHHNFL